MNRIRILTYVVLCVSVALAVKLILDGSEPTELQRAPQLVPETEDVTIPRFPREYALGAFDERFGISRERFLQLAEEATKVWETAAGRDLFQYTPDAHLRVNLVYDWRQERLVKALEERAKIDESGASFDNLRAEYERKAPVAMAAQRSYEESAQASRVHLEEFNARVNRWNEGENRSESESQYLQNRKVELDEEFATVEKKRAELKSLFDELNALAERINTLARKYNLEVELFNGTFVDQREFEKGLFDGRSIDVYEFEKEDDLRITLVHEFGHALGMEHVDNPRSIMYRKLSAQDMREIRPTSEDLAQLISKLK